MATDFFERQRRARSQTLKLRILFALAMAMASLLVAAGVVLMASSLSPRMLLTLDFEFVLRRAFLPGGLGWWIAGAVMAFSLAASARTAWKLRDGGGELARSLRGVPVPADSPDPRHRTLLNIVAEMSLASRVPQPAVWVLEDEPGINAFAAGKRLEGAVIGVTAGALDRLDRDELQAIIAHEFSHVLNGDMALNTRLIAWLSGLFAIERFARRLRERGRKSGKKRGGGMWWLRVGVLLFHACGYVGLMIGRLLQAAISRRRETLADASAVQFTRNPAGLRRALLKIAALEGTGVIRAPAATGMAHLFFADSDTSPGHWLDTHPRMIDRVRALDTRLTEAQYRAAVRIERKRQLTRRDPDSGRQPI